MKKFTFFVLSILLLSDCQKETSPVSPDEQLNGEILMQMDMTSAPVEVTEITGKLSREGFPRSR